MAVFLVKMDHTPNICTSINNPPLCYALKAACGCFFPDVTTATQFAAYIEQLACDHNNAPGSATCASGNYCPGDPTLREQMARFLVLTFNLS
jgi:hypothetical protein